MPAKDKSKLTHVYSKMQRLEITFSQLEMEWSTHRAYWRDLLDYTQPWRGRFTTTESGKGTRKLQKILNSRATEDLNILKAGMMASVTNPSINWIRLTLEDKDLAEEGPIKEWLGDVTKIINDIILKSNFYKTAPTIYGDMACIGTAALLVEEDFDTVVRFYAIPIGSYMIAVDNKGRVNQYAREFRYSVRQLIEKFSFEEGEPLIEANINWDLFSEKVKQFWETGLHNQWVDVCHMIVPNEEYDPSRLEAKYKKYASVYFEKGSTGNSSARNQRHNPSSKADKFLQESGLDLFNVLVPRWEVVGEDAYGTNCPAMMAHGPNRALQTMERRKAQAVEHKVNPALAVPASLKKRKNSTLPGDRVYMGSEDIRAGGIKPIYEVNFDTRELREDIQNNEFMVDAAFYRDAFAPISADPVQGTPPSAAEINQRVSESRLKLGGTTQNVNDDLLEPMVDIIFHYGEMQGRFPEAPPAIEGAELRVEFIGVLAQAQKTVALGGLREITDFAMNIAAQTQDPTLLDKLRMDQLIDEYAEGTGVTPDVIVPDDEVEMIRAERAQQQQAQQAQEAMASMAGTAKDLSQADIGGQNALTKLMEEGAV